MIGFPSPPNVVSAPPPWPPNQALSYESCGSRALPLIFMNTSLNPSTALRIIAENDELQDQLRADADLIPSFIEEVLRHQGMVKHIGRVARVTTEVAGRVLAVVTERLGAPGGLAKTGPS